ncbi:hypothetical protein IOC57_19460 [Bacillus sp. SD075]|uniref:hypothetical protein n=1 Tax=Bacillus sp. SD075 TaxID=2781732 RepID=UPI001A961374|nr:hypothetical protein [Bacillus sp. SD075]MBO0999910.1 hypothetical protein [Bacillus sp. SD075]
MIKSPLKEEPNIRYRSITLNKEEILERIFQTNPGATVAIRSVDGIHQLLYEPVDATRFSKVTCQEVGRKIADSFIINSTIITHSNSDTMERVASAIRFYFMEKEMPINLLDIISLLKYNHLHKVID